MADGQQQLAFGIQHALNIVGHAVDAARQIAEFVAAFDVDAMRKVTGADACEPGLEYFNRREQFARAVVQQHQNHQQHNQGHHAPMPRAAFTGRRGPQGQSVLRQMSNQIFAVVPGAEFKIDIVAGKAPVHVHMCQVKHCCVGRPGAVRSMNMNLNVQFIRQLCGAREVGRHADIRLDVLHVAQQVRSHGVLKVRAECIADAQTHQ